MRRPDPFVFSEPGCSACAHFRPAIRGRSPDDCCRTEAAISCATARVDDPLGRWLDRLRPRHHRACGSSARHFTPRPPAGERC